MIIRWSSRCDTSSSVGFSGSAVVRWTVRPEVVEGGKDKARTRSHEFLTTIIAMREGTKKIKKRALPRSTRIGQ